MDPWRSPLALLPSGEIDLHTFRPADLEPLLLDWIITCRQAGRLEVRIIHGKGQGVARARVASLLGRCPLVRDYTVGPGGNHGVTVARLFGRATDETRARDLALGCPRLMEALEAVASLGRPGLWLGGGALRNPLWWRLAGREGEPEATDLDVLWHDPAGDPSEAEVRAALDHALPGRDWDAVNQALRPDPAPSLAEALARWPETATAVAARLEGGRLVFLAPHGWDDLLAMIVRRSPSLPEEVYRERLTQKRWRERFPEVTVMR